MVESSQTSKDRLTLQNPRTARQFAAAALAVAGAELFPLDLLPSAQVSFVATVILAMALLHGWRAAAALALVALIIGWSAGQPVGPRLTLLLAAVAAGVVLRSATSCMPVLALLLTPKFMAYGWSLYSGTAGDPWLTAAVAVIEATANTALAIGCIVLVPRRDPPEPTLARVNTGHVMFLLVAGSTAFTAIGMLGTLQPSTLEDSLWPQVCALLIAALLITHLATLYAETLLRGIQRWVGRDLTSAPRLLSAGLEESLASVLRERHQLRHSLIDRCHELESVARQNEQLRKLAETSRRLLEQCLRRLRQSERAVRIVQSRYRILMSQCTDIALFVTRDGRIESASRSILRLLGYDPAAVRGRPLNLLIPRDQTSGHPLRSIEAAAASRAPLATTLRTAAGKGFDTHIEIRRFPQPDGDHYAIHVRDPSSKHAASTAAASAQERAEHARSRDLFIATMSHELRTPLHGLLATLEMMRAEQQSPQQLQQHLSVARLSARSLLKIANDILDLTRINSGHFTLQHEAFALQRLLQEVTEGFGAQADALRLYLSLHIVDDLPPSFMGDPVRVKQIMNNLVSNALKFTKRGGVDMNVSYDGQRITIDVIDAGQGVPADQRDAIFDPFVRAHPTHSIHGGTGLGLPISRRLAQAMGGDLVLLRSSEAGSAFRLTLPLEASQQSPREEQSQRLFRNPRGRILVVEDNSTNRFVAEALLAGLRCPATIVDNGSEAIRLHSEQRFDLILMDCRMPGMDGYETARRIRALSQHRVPIIAMTASAMAEERHRCLQAGMDDFLPKPFGRAALHDMLCKWLHSDKRRGSTATDPAHELPDLDTKVFDELSRSVHHERAPLQRICESFVESAAKLPPLLNGDTTDAAALKYRLHSDLGCAGTVGARRVEHLARQLQAVLADGDDIDPLASATAISQAIRSFQQQFYRRLEEHSMLDVQRRDRA